MGENRDEETGQYTQRYAIEEFKTAVSHLEPQASTRAVAQHVGSSHELAYKRLLELKEDGIVESAKIGNALVWLIQKDRRTESGREHREPKIETQDTDRQAKTTQGVGDEEVHPAVENLDIAGSGTVLKSRKQLIDRMYSRVLEEGSVDVGELKSMVEPSEVNYSSIEAVWANMIRGGGVRDPVFDRLPNVETPGKGGRTYRRID